MSNNQDTASTQPQDDLNDPLAIYSRALHEYTLRLWAESQRAAEQHNSSRAQAAASTDTGGSGHQQQQVQDGSSQSGSANSQEAS